MPIEYSYEFRQISVSRERTSGPDLGTLSEPPWARFLWYKKRSPDSYMESYLQVLSYRALYVEAEALPKIGGQVLTVLSDGLDKLIQVFDQPWLVGEVLIVTSDDPFFPEIDF